MLRRRIRWTTPSGKEVLIEDDRLVSFEEKHLAILRLEVTVLNADAPVTINCQLINRQDGEDVYGGTPPAPKKAGFDPRKAERIHERVLQPEEYWQDGGRSALSYRVTESGHDASPSSPTTSSRPRTSTPRAASIEPDIAKNVFRVQAKAGVPIRLTKLVSYHTSRGVPARELVDRCRRTLDRAEVEGVERQYERQRAWLDEFWERSDVRIAGHDDLQQATRWCLFQLAQAAARADGQGVPAKGVTGSGYSGHYFWDTEIYVLPFLAYTTPALGAQRAADAVPDAPRRPPPRAPAQRGTARCSPGARSTAKRHPPTTRPARRSTTSTPTSASRSRSTSARPATSSSSTARASTSPSRPRGCGTTLGFWRTSDGDGEESFHIHGVTGPDEYTTVVNDNLFTNVMARFNLRFAARTVREMARGRSRGVPADGRPPAPRPVASRRRGSGPPRRCTSRSAPRSASTRRMRCSSSARCGTSSTRPPISGRCCCTSTRW